MANYQVKMINLDLSKMRQNCQTVVSTKVSGITVRDLVVECRLERMAPFSRDTGSVISLMAEAE